MNQHPCIDKVNYTRAVLGLAGSYFYPFDEKKTITIKHIPRPDEKEIERYKSPLFFKPINGNLYLLAQEFDTIILDQKFKFSCGDNETILNTPQDFNLEEMLTQHLNQNWKKLE